MHTFYTSPDIREAVLSKAEADLFAETAEIVATEWRPDLAGDGELTNDQSAELDEILLVDGVAGLEAAMERAEGTDDIHAILAIAALAMEYRANTAAGNETLDSLRTLALDGLDLAIRVIRGPTTLVQVV